MGALSLLNPPPRVYGVNSTEEEWRASLRHSIDCWLMDEEEGAESPSLVEAIQYNFPQIGLRDLLLAGSGLWRVDTVNEEPLDDEASDWCDPTTSEPPAPAKHVPPPPPLKRGADLGEGGA